MKLVLVMATTADGMIARDPMHFPDWTGKVDKRMFKKISLAAGVVIMGSRTYQAIGKPLPERLNVVFTRRPDAFQSAHAPNLMFTSDHPRRLLQQLASKGYQNAILAGGAMINSLFLGHQLIDEMMLSVIPRIFGQGISLFADPVDMRLSLINSKVMESDLHLLHYRLHYPPLMKE